MTQEYIDMVEGAVADAMGLINHEFIEEVRGVFIDYYEDHRIDAGSLEDAIALAKARILREASYLGDQEQIKNQFLFYVEVPIIIKFPEVTIQNERGQTHDIKDLFVRVILNYSGGFRNHAAIRSTFSYEEFASRYIHSHVQNYAQPDSWRSICVGQGPLSRTCRSLAGLPEIHLWQLYCRELEVWTTVESEAGGPYAYMRNIHSSSNKMPLNQTFVETDTVRASIPPAFVQHFLMNVDLEFNYVDGAYGIAMSNTDFLLLLSSEFLKWVNDNCEAHEARRYGRAASLMRGVVFEDAIFTGSSVDTEAAGQLVLSFKNLPVPLVIAASPEEDNMSTVVHPRIGTYMYQHILSIINYDSDYISGEADTYEPFNCKHSIIPLTH